MESYETILKAMNDKYKSLTGFEPDDASDIGIRLRVLAGELANAYAQLNEFKAQIFPHTATGEYLDMHAKCRGLERKSAVAASGCVRFYRSTPSAENITIPAGIICSTSGENALRFETTQQAVLYAGSLYADAPARAVEAGAKSNVAANTVNIMITPAQGVSSVSNILPFCGGSDEESDQTLRNRLIQSYSNISNGTNSAFYLKEALSFDFVSSAYVLPRERGLGTVDIIVSKNGALLDSGELKQIQDRMNELKEISVDVLVRNAEPISASIEIELAAQNGYSFASVAAECKNAAESFINSLGVGKPLLLAMLYKQLMCCGGVYNCRIISPAEDLRINSTQILTAGNIAFKQMAVSS
ncbi:MAG TPA: hypothetical protein DCP97_00450 [Ruminococcaceae bacterium]|nr:hypothetical protein [Oscillospiraceae bacterium]